MKDRIETKTAKGYRLKPGTHDMVTRLQKVIRGDKDDVIDLACTRLLNEFESLKKQHKLKKKKK